MKTKYKEIANHETIRIVQGVESKKATKVKEVLTRGTKPSGQAFARIYLTDNGQASGNAIFSNLSSNDLTITPTALPTEGNPTTLDDAPWVGPVLVDTVANKYVDVYVIHLNVGLLGSGIAFFTEHACAVDLRVIETKYD